MTFGQYGKPKMCNNNCGQEIAWDKMANYFINTSNSARHECPKWEKKSSYSKEVGGGEARLIDEPTIEAISAIQAQITKIEQSVSMSNWMLEKVAKKLGVEDLIDESK